MPEIVNYSVRLMGASSVCEYDTTGPNYDYSDNNFGTMACLSILSMLFTASLNLNMHAVRKTVGERSVLLPHSKQPPGLSPNLTEGFSCLQEFSPEVLWLRAAWPQCCYQCVVCVHG